MTDTPTPPEVVNPSAVPPATKSVLSDLLVVATFFPILATLLGKHDVVGLIQALQTTDGALFLAVVLPAIASTWRARLRVLRWARAIRWAREAPDSVVQVKDASPPPSV